ncbi:MAG: hypothetical protein WA771_03025 [Chthoniobacterales bacterium]
MKTPNLTLLAATAAFLITTAGTTLAKPPGGNGGPGNGSQRSGHQAASDQRGGHQPGGSQQGGGQRGPQGGPPPVLKALDTDQDGVVSAEEIAAASTALATLDANGDGELTRDELRPPRGKRSQSEE